VYCAGSSGLGFDFFAMARRYSHQSSKGNHSWSGDSGSRFLVSCLVREPLPGRAFDGDSFALHVVNAELGAVVHAEVELREVAVKVLAIDLLVDADQAALEHRKEPFKRVHMHVARTHSYLE
jgi:hypothetical protein